MKTKVASCNVDDIFHEVKCKFFKFVFYHYRNIKRLIGVKHKWASLHVDYNLVNI